MRNGSNAIEVSISRMTADGRVALLQAIFKGRRVVMLYHLSPWLPEPSEEAPPLQPARRQIKTWSNVQGHTWTQHLSPHIPLARMQSYGHT